MIIRHANQSDLSKQNIESLHDLINREYADGESGLFLPGTKRITLPALTTLLENNSLLLAVINDHVVGCVCIEKINADKSLFGMLAADRNYRGTGIGRALVFAAEQSAIEHGSTAMCLELLMPTHWRQPHKEFLKAWYHRLGYV